MSRFFLSLFLLCAFANSTTLNFKFIEKDTEDQIPNTSVDVIVENTDHTKSISTEPNDSTILLYSGTNYIYLFGWGFIKQIDTIFVADESHLIHKTYFLERAVIEPNSDLENYHSHLKIFYEKDSLLSVKIDTVIFSENNFLISFSFFNYADVPVYVLRTIGCIDPVTLDLFDENGTKIKRHAIRVDCIGEKLYPDSTDLIEILPNTSLCYPLYKAYYFDRSKLRPGNYIVKFSYEYKKPDFFFFGTLPKNYRQLYHDEINTINKTLRGKFSSSNNYILNVF